MKGIVILPSEDAIIAFFLAQKSMPLASIISHQKINSTLGSGFFSDEILEMIWSMNSFGECEKKLSKTDPQIRKNELSSKRIILFFIKNF